MRESVSEQSFEESIERTLLSGGPDDPSARPTGVREELPPYGENVSGGYARRRPEDYDRALCLIPRDVVDFILATQPK